MPTLTIDGKETSVEPGTTIIRACEKENIDVPRYCYHPALSVAGNCRICMVEVEGAPKPMIACQTVCHDGMIVKTNTETVKQLQAHVLEFLLLNHPLDCPVCDQSGECQLQDYYMQYGLYNPMFNEDKVKKSKKAFPIGPTIMLDQERCILCTRCVRFTDEITKTYEFGVVERGNRTEITVGQEFKNDYSGNVADICPVGALTDRDFRFKLRVWYLKSTNSVCPGCSRGCNIFIDSNARGSYKADGKRVMRLRPRENQLVNQWWICDEGRYGYKFIDEKRLTKIKGAESWEEAISRTASKLEQLAVSNPRSLAVLLSPQQPNEELYVANVLFRQLVGKERVFLLSPKSKGKEDDFLMRADKNPNTTGAKLLGLAFQDRLMEKLCEEASSGSLKGLYLFGQDLVSLYGVKAQQMFKKLDFMVFQGSNRNETAPLASMVLPCSVYAEEEGTFTNFDFYVQRFERAMLPSEGVWEGRKILTKIAEQLKLQVPSGGSREIFDHMAKHTDGFKGMGYEKLGRVKEALA